MDKMETFHENVKNILLKLKCFVKVINLKPAY